MNNKTLEELEAKIDNLRGIVKDLTEVVSELVETGKLNVKLFQILNDKIKEKKNPYNL